MGDLDDPTGTHVWTDPAGNPPTAPGVGQPLSKPTLTTLSRAIERYALSIGPGAVVVSTFQRSGYFARSAPRYSTLAGAGVTTVAVYAGERFDAPGVHSVVLSDDHPLATEWGTLLLSSSLAVFVGGQDLVALDESSLTVESGRRFLARLTFDHATVVEHGERYLSQFGDSLDVDTAATLAAAVAACRRRLPSEDERAMAAATSVLVERLEQQQRTLAVTRDALLAETERADIDPLTGLLNRSGLERWLGVDPTTATDAELPPTGLILVDLDDFKRVNDRFGHTVGDELLANVGIAVRGSVRPGDVVCRWGGDEFVVLCPGASDADLVSIGDRLVEAIEAVSVGGAVVTASVGCQSSSRHPFPIAAADDAMFRAKSSGGGTRVLAD
jgi:diguanylate cyclase (GGDEF)-like protein